MLRITYKSVLLAGSVLAASSVPALAQDSADIVVTARRVEERLQDVPLSIQVFNQEQLSQKNISSATDLATYTPSLSQNTTFGSDNARFQIRGFVQEGDSVPSVGVYFADAVSLRGAGNSVNSGNGAGPGSFFDLQNVQVLKGPQGTLFGRNTTGGSILIVPQKPTDKLEGYVEGSIGNYDMKRVQAVLNVPLADTFKVRLGVDRQKRDGWLRNYSGIGPKDFNDIDYIALRGSIVADLTPDLENYTVVSYSKSDNNGTAQRVLGCDPTVPTPPAPFRRQAFFGPLCTGLVARRDAAAAAAGRPNDPYGVMNPHADAHVTTEQWQIVNTTTWTASDHITVKNIASYGQFRQNLLMEFFGTGFNSADLVPGSTPYNFGFSSIGGLEGGDMTRQSTFTEELQLQGNFMDGRLTWVLGGFYEASLPLGRAGNAPPILASCINYATFQCTDPLSVPVAFGFASVGSINTQEAQIRFYNHAFFAQATYGITDKLKITGGFRYTWDKQTNTSIQKSYNFANAPVYGLRPGQPPFSCVYASKTTVAQNCSVTFPDAKSDAPTWLIDLVYQPSQDLMLYGKYGRGYRAGTIAAAVPIPQFNLVKPEKVDFFEAGVKSSWSGAISGFFNVSAFYNKFSNQQIQVGIQSLTTTQRTAAPVNAGRSKIWGLEVSGSLGLFEGFRLSGDYTYLRTKITGGVPTAAAANGFAFIPEFFVGDPLILAPRHKLSLTAAYTLPLDESVGNVTLSGTFTHTSSMLSNYKDRTSNTLAFRQYSTLPAYSLVNLNLSWNSIAGSPVDLSLFVTNLTKKYYYTFIPGLGQATPLETAALGEPRMFGMRLKYRFGD
ncbi:MAG TPA: TonB-dependent receptor [Novosphingobium sp.]